MTSRDTDEEHRASTPLELLFDLCFVVAVSRAAALLHHAIAADDAGSAVVSYVLVFFAIWWAWMNFTWFSSAYDNDDVLYRVGVFVQIVGPEKETVLRLGDEFNCEARNGLYAELRVLFGAD